MTCRNTFTAHQSRWSDLSTLSVQDWNNSSTTIAWPHVYGKIHYKTNFDTVSGEV